MSRRSKRVSTGIITSYADQQNLSEDDQEAARSPSFEQEEEVAAPQEPAKKVRRITSSKAKREVNEASNGPDLIISTSVGTTASTRRSQNRSNKTRDIRAEWSLGLYEPADLALVSPAHLGPNEDEAYQPAALSSAQGLPWPKDGLINTRLSNTAFAMLKTDRYKFWCAQTGWVPREGLFDASWWPGKSVGYKASQLKTDWKQRQQSTFAQGSVGDPFVLTPSTLQLLSSTESEPYIRGTAMSTALSPSVALKHPTTVMRLSTAQTKPAARRSVINSSGKTRKEEDEDSGSAEDDQPDTTDDVTQNANQIDIDREDPKFSGLVNVGMEEPLPVIGEVLEITMGASPSVSIARGTGQRLDSLGVTSNEGHILNVGGHVYDLGWAPVPIHLNQGKEYFAVSAAATVLPQTYIGKKATGPQSSSIQIWSVSPNGAESKGEARLEMYLCHDLGTAWKLAWCPLGHSFLPPPSRDTISAAPRRLGLLAACFEDGSTCIFSVPYPDEVSSDSNAHPISVRVEPIVRLTIPRSASTCLSWAGGELLAVGTSDGHVVVWDVGTHLRSGSTSTHIIPRSYVRVHRAPVSSLDWISLPPITVSGVARHNQYPTQIFTVSMDGWTCIVDLLDPNSTASLDRSRSVHYASTFAPHGGGVLAHENSDGSIGYYSLRAEELYRSRVVSHTPARVLSLSASNFHPMLAAGTAHGQVKSCNIIRSSKRSGKQHTQRVHLPIYQLRLDRTTGQLSIWHKLNPQMANTFEHKSWTIPTWPTILNITAVQWNPNFGRANLLLSGSAAGIVKIDCVDSPF